MIIGISKSWQIFDASLVGLLSFMIKSSFQFKDYLLKLLPKIESSKYIKNVLSFRLLPICIFGCSVYFLIEALS